MHRHDTAQPFAWRTTRASGSVYLAGGSDDARARCGRDAAGDGTLLVAPQPPGLPLRRCRRCRRRCFGLRHGGARPGKKTRSPFPLPDSAEAEPSEAESADRSIGSWTVQISSHVVRSRYGPDPRGYGEPFHHPAPAGLPARPSPMDQP